jgi:hypothetical protein
VKTSMNSAYISNLLVAACAFFFLGGGACGLVVKTTCGMLQLRTLFSDNCTSIGGPVGLRCEASVVLYWDRARLRLSLDLVAEPSRGTSQLRSCPSGQLFRPACFQNVTFAYE